MARLVFPKYFFLEKKMFLKENPKKLEKKDVP